MARQPNINQLDGLSAWLSSVPSPALAQLLRERPDVIAPPEPRDLAELAERLGSADSLARLLRRQPVSYVQLSEALTALGGSATRSTLTVTLAGDRRDAVDAVVNRLISFGVLWPADADTVTGPPSLSALFPAPLGLGPPLRALLSTCSVDTMRAVLRALGVNRVEGRRAVVEDALVARLGDADLVRSIVDAAPPDVQAELRRRAAESDPDVAAIYDLNRTRARIDAGRWALERGIMIGSSYGYDWVMSAEVGLALRGPGWRARFDPDRPEVRAVPVVEDSINSDATAALSSFADQSVSILDRIARTGVPALKSGGVGTRELTKLARATGTSEPQVRVGLELARAADLIRGDGKTVAVTEDFDAWRGADPAERIAALLRTWWELGDTPSAARDSDGRTRPAMAARPDCHGCRLARQALLRTATELPPGTSASADELARATLWAQPFVHAVAQPDETPFALVLAEAQLLGLMSRNAVGAVGRALVEGDDDALLGAVASAVPEASDWATFGADLTVLVVGSPTRRASALLDSAADREGSGGATVWRFTPGSVRRALDAGVAAATLVDALAGIATAELPQPLRYLIADVGRRHGSLRVSATVSVVRSDDEALLAQAAADRSLRKLGLRQVAPTVLTSALPETDTLTALRAAGYLPMPGRSGEEGTATLVAEPRPLAAVRNLIRADAGSRPTATAPPDPDALATWLLSGPPATTTSSVTERALSRQTKMLSSSELRLLAHAVDHRSSVGIEYVSSSGGLTVRTITGPELSSGSLFAWCELRQDDRVFTVSRIQAVFPPG